MASRARIVDCPGCGASEFVIRVYDDEPEITALDCADCGRQLAEVGGLTVDDAVDGPQPVTWGRF